MKSVFISKSTFDLQNSLYFKLNKFSYSHQILGRLCSIPVSLIDVTLDTYQCPLNAIQNSALAVINLIGVIFSNKYNLKDALICADWAISNTFATPGKFFTAPFKVIFQFFTIIIDPVKAQSINFNKPAFRI